MRRTICTLLVVWTICWILGGGVAAQTDEPPVAPGAARPAFDPEAATEAWLARLSPAQRARSDAYFEGGYWIDLWDFLWGLGIAWLFLGTRLSARLRDA